MVVSGGHVAKESARAIFLVMAQLATLTEVHATVLAAVGLLAGMRVLVLLKVLLQAEGLAAKATLHRLLRVVLLVVTHERVLCGERSFATANIALEDW